MRPSLHTLPWQRESTRQLKDPVPYKAVDSGLIGFKEAFALQQSLLALRIQKKIPDTLLLCEHFPVLTLGRLGKAENILVPSEKLNLEGLEVIPINRGGDITFHGPGQLVMYPIFDLAGHKKDLRFFLRLLEEAVIEFLGHYGCFASRKTGFTGVWLGERKIASIGIGVKKWVAFHGVAININTDLRYFSLINPCGLKVEMISLAKHLGRAVDMAEAKEVMTQMFEQVFNLEPVYLNLPQR